MVITAAIIKLYYYSYKHSTLSQFLIFNYMFIFDYNIFTIYLPFVVCSHSTISSLLIYLYIYIYIYVNMYIACKLIILCNGLLMELNFCAH